MSPLPSTPTSPTRTFVETLLRTDPRDAGCEETARLLHVYADLVADGEDPDARYPGISTHLRSCPPCADDVQGLLDLVTTTDVARKDRPAT